MRVDVGGAPRNPPHSYITATTTILGPDHEPTMRDRGCNHLPLHGAPLTLALHQRIHQREDMRTSHALGPIKIH